MGKTTGRILKGSNVELQGQLHLDAMQAAHGLPKKKDGTSVAPQVRILENHPEFAVIELTCCCGTKTHLRCEYVGGQSPADQKPDQTE